MKFDGHTSTLNPANDRAVCMRCEANVLNDFDVNDFIVAGIVEIGKNRGF